MTITDRLTSAATLVRDDGPTDTKKVYIGRYEVTGELPSPASIVRI